MANAENTTPLRLTAKRSHNFKDITGTRFGHLTVVRYLYTHIKTAHWECLCDCGNTKKPEDQTFALVTPHLAVENASILRCTDSAYIRCIQSGTQ